MLASIEQHREGLHQLNEPIVPSPWADASALERDAALEQAAANRVPDGDIAALAGADLAHDARIAALDLSLVDDRFAPHLLAAEAEHAVRAWAEAVDGDDAALESVADPHAVVQLLYAGDPERRRRLVVRGPRIRGLRIEQLDARDRPATMLVALEVGGHRYVEDRQTAVLLEGDRSLESTFVVRWRMVLTDDPGRPWRIASVVERAAAQP